MNWTIIILSVSALIVVLTLMLRHKKLKEINFKFGFFQGVEMNYKFYK